MDIHRARYLRSPAGQEALASLAPSLARLSPTQLATELRRTFPPFEASALAEQVTLRAKAETRFGYDPGFLLSEPGLEMMTHPIVAERRARRLGNLALPVADLTCGLGGDLRAAQRFADRAAGVESDPTTALLASANCHGMVAVGDATRAPFALERHAVIIDPARRTTAGRRFDPAAFEPRFDVALELLGQARAGVLKAPPGIDHAHLPASAEVEFIQLGRSMREAAVWTGEGSSPGLRRAVLLPAGRELTSDEPEASPETVEIGAVVFDPESCVTRAGLVRHLASRLEARLLDPHIAYLTADAPAFDPLAATFEVLEVLPFSVSGLKRRFRDAGWIPDEIRRRAFPVEPDELRRLLGRTSRKDGAARVTLLCTTIAGRRTVIVARRLLANPKNCEGV